MSSLQLRFPSDEQYAWRGGIEFIVYGKPQPAGSKSGFPFKRKDGSLGVKMRDSNTNAGQWKQEVRATARSVFAGMPLIEHALKAWFLFCVPRTKGHFRSGKYAHLLRDDAPPAPITRPDVLKWARAIEDALTGVIYKDDSLIVSEELHKRFGPISCAIVRISDYTPSDEISVQHAIKRTERAMRMEDV